MKKPDWTALPATVPPAVVTVLRRCLEKDRKQRARDIGDVSLALDGAFETAGPQIAAPTPEAHSPFRIRLQLISGAFLSGGGCSCKTNQRRRPRAEERRDQRVGLLVAPFSAFS